MKSTYIVIFNDGYRTTVTAYDTSEAWEKALEIKHAGKIVDVWME